MEEPDSFRFLEMQDHVEYLDARSRALELSVLGPLFLAGKKLRDRGGGPAVDIAIALLWGAFVGVVKAGRLGYLRIDGKKLAEAGTAAWQLIAPRASRAVDSSSSETSASRATGTSASRGAGNSASRGAGNSASRATGILELRGKKPISSQRRKKGS
jgi:hypothetical protein